MESWQRRITDFARELNPSDDERKDASYDRRGRPSPNYKRLFTVDIPRLNHDDFKIFVNRNIISSVSYRRRAVYFYRLAEYAYWSLRLKHNTKSHRYSLRFWHRHWNRLATRCSKIAKSKYKVDKLVFTKDDKRGAQLDAFDDFIDLCHYNKIKYTVRLPVVK